jgi:hypothetical protein
MGYDIDAMFTLLNDLVSSAGDGGIRPDGVDEALAFLDWAQNRLLLMREMGYA